MDLAAVEADIDVTHLQHAQVGGHQQDLDEQFADLRQKGLAKVGNRIVIRMQATRNEAERNGFVSGLLELARTEHAGGVAIKQQPQEQFRRKRRTAHRRIASIDGLQVQQGNDAHDEAGQMVGRQTLFKCDGLFQCCFVVDRNELTHRG